MLGYNHQTIGMNGWGHDDNQSQYKYERLMSNEGLIITPHMDTIYKYQEVLEGEMSIIIQILEYVIQNINLLEDNNFLTELSKNIKKHLDNIEIGFIPLDKHILNIYEYLLSTQFQLSENEIKKEIENITNKPIATEFICSQLLKSLESLKIEKIREISKESKTK